MEHQEYESGDVDWNNLKLLLCLVQTGSFRSAAGVLNMPVNVLRRRIAVLETQIGGACFIRDHQGVRLTPLGTELTAACEQMLRASTAVTRLARRTERNLTGKVTIGVTEGLGTFWLVPRMIEFQRTHPNIWLDLKCTMDMADVYNMEVDISVQLDVPQKPNLVVTRLGSLHVMLFASEDYLQTHGVPSSLPDLVNFRFVEQVSGQVQSSMLGSYFPNAPEGFVAVRTNTSSAHAYAISQGAGIGVLPTYARAVTKRVRPICPDFRFRRDIWMAYNKQARLSERVVASIRWLKQSFNARRYPWFADEFVPPDVFEKQFANASTLHLFEGFRDV